MCKVIAFLGFNLSSKSSNLATRVASALSSSGLKGTIIQFRDTIQDQSKEFWPSEERPKSEKITVLRNSARSFSVVDDSSVSAANIGNLNSNEWRNFVRFELPALVDTSDVFLLDIPDLSDEVIYALSMNPVSMIIVLNPEQVGAGAIFDIAKILKKNLIKEVSVILNEVDFQELADLMCARLSFDMSFIDSPEMKLIGCLPAKPLKSRNGHFSALEESDSQALKELMLKIRNIRVCADARENMGSILDAVRRATLIASPLELNDNTDVESKLMDNTLFGANEFDNM